MMIEQDTIESIIRRIKRRRESKIAYTLKHIVRNTTNIQQSNELKIEKASAATNMVITKATRRKEDNIEKIIERISGRHRG